MRRDLISAWLQKAGHDLDLAMLALEHRPAYADLICFHAQQAAEKYLKALLVSLEITPPKTHNLAYLVDLAVERRKEAAVIYDKVEPLEGYAVEARYPDLTISLTAEDARRAYELASSVGQWIERMLAENGARSV